MNNRIKTKQMIPEAVQIAIISSITQIILAIINTLLNRNNSRKLDKIIKKDKKSSTWNTNKTKNIL